MPVDVSIDRIHRDKRWPPNLTAVFSKLGTEACPPQDSRGWDAEWLVLTCLWGRQRKGALLCTVYIFAAEKI